MFSLERVSFYDYFCVCLSFAYVCLILIDFHYRTLDLHCILLTFLDPFCFCFGVLWHEMTPCLQYLQYGK